MGEKSWKACRTWRGLCCYPDQIGSYWKVTLCFHSDSHDENRLRSVGQKEEDQKRDTQSSEDRGLNQGVTSSENMDDSIW